MRGLYCFAAGAVAAAVLLNVCWAMEGEDPVTNGKMDLYNNELYNNELYLAIKDRVDEKMLQWNGVDNEILPADFDEDTEKMMDMMDIAAEMLEEEDEFDEEMAEIDESLEEDEEEGVTPEARGGKRRGRPSRRHGWKSWAKGVQKMAQKHGKKHQLAMFSKMDTPRRCMDMESQVDVLCNRIKIAQHSPLMEKLFMMMSQKNGDIGGRKAGWSSCCAEDESDRLACFTKRRSDRMDNMCAKKSDKKEKYATCCQEEERDGCIADYKEVVCSSLEVEQKPTKGGRTRGGGQGRRYNKKHDKRGGKQRHGFSEKVFNQCCEAADNASMSEDFTSRSPKQCLSDLVDWKAEAENKTLGGGFACIKGYLSCCIDNESADEREIKAVYREAFSMMKQQRNEQASNETSPSGIEQEEEEDEDQKKGRHHRGGKIWRGKNLGNSSSEETENEKSQTKPGKVSKHGGKKVDGKKMDGKKGRGMKQDKNEAGESDEDEEEDDKPTKGRHPTGKRGGKPVNKKNMQKKDGKMGNRQDKKQERKQDKKQEKKQERKNFRQGKRQQMPATEIASTSEIKIAFAPEEEQLLIEEQSFIVPDETIQQIEENDEKLVEENKMAPKPASNGKMEKVPVGWNGERYPGGRKMPDGMRFDERSGQYYYVDKLPEKWGSERPGHRVSRKPAASY